MRKAFLLTTLLLLVMLVAEASAQTAPWWKPAWTRRAPITVSGGGAAFPAVPVILYGRTIEEAAGGEAVAVGSLRVVGPQGEVPCQFDECDGTGAFVSAPNHELDPDDELSFQADLPAQGEARYYLYWSTASMPPGRYPGTVRVHEPVEPDAFLGDIQFHNREAFVGMKGPGTGADLTKNAAENWGNGVVTFMDLYHRRLLGGGWASIFPQGALFCSPGTEIAKWQTPRAIARGPVRAGASCLLPEATLSLPNDQTARVRVEHRTWLWDRGAIVFLEERFTPLDPIASLRRGYSCGWNLNPGGTDRIFYSVKGESRLYQPTAEQLQQGTGLRFNQPTDPWMVKYSPSDRFLTGALLDEGEPRAGDLREGSSYGYADVTLRHYDTLNNLAANETLYRRFWYLALPGDYADGALAHAFPQVFSSRAVSLGAAEKGGAR